MITNISNANLNLYNGTSIKLIDVPSHFILQNCLQKHFCNYILQNIDANSYETGSVHKISSRYNDQKINYAHKSCSTFNLNNHLLLKEFHNICLSNIKSVLPNNKFKLIPEGTLFNYYNGNKKQFFGPHTDNAYLKNNELIITNENRHLTTILFLNDNYDGGEFVFDSLINDNKEKIKLKPSQGDILIFPADIRYPHHIEQVLNGERFTAVNWYSIL